MIVFWNELKHKWGQLYRNNLTVTDKLFGIYINGDDNDDWLLKNQILLTARRYIYICRYRGAPLSIGVFDLLLRDTARLEETLARQRESLEFHYRKWDKTGIYL